MSDHLPVTCTAALPKLAADQSPADFLNNQKCRHYSLRWDKGDLSSYYKSTGELLQSVRVPYDLLSTECNDVTCCHGDAISAYYNCITTVLSDCANYCIPIINNDALKPYWTDELTELKEVSMHTVSGLIVVNQKLAL